ncbi:glutamate receptor ionotropic delta-1, partial [Biomphalaria pfeifferi]
EIHFVIGPLTITSSRAAVIDFTTPYMEDGTGILTKKPDPDSDTVSGFFRLFKAMKPMVWACLCGSVIGVSFIIYLVDRWSPFSERRSSKMDDTPVSSFFNSFWSALGSMLAQGSEYQPKSSSARVILGFWWLFTIILVSTYTANMTAVLTVTIREQPINSITELAGQSQVKPLVKLGTNLYTLFEEAKDNIYQTIWKMMSGNEVKARTNQEALAFVKTGKYAFLTDRAQLEYIVKNDCLTYALAEDVFNTAGMGFVLPKNAEFLKSVDD